MNAFPSSPSLPPRVPKVTSLQMIRCPERSRMSELGSPQMARLHKWWEKTTAQTSSINHIRTCVCALMHLFVYARERQREKTSESSKNSVDCDLSGALGLQSVKRLAVTSSAEKVVPG